MSDSTPQVSPPPSDDQPTTSLLAPLVRIAFPAVLVFILVVFFRRHLLRCFRGFKSHFVPDPDRQTPPPRPHQHQQHQQQHHHHHLRRHSSAPAQYQPSAPPPHQHTLYTQFYTHNNNNNNNTAYPFHAHAHARGPRVHRPSSMFPSPPSPPPPAAVGSSSASASVSHRPFDMSQLLVEFPSSESHVDMPCPVCLEPLGEPQGQLAAPPCTHPFHVDCIRQWLHRDPQRTCPVCRVSYILYSGRTIREGHHTPGDSAL